MKRIKHFFFPLLFALPIFMSSPAKANNGHDRHLDGRERDHRSAEDFDRDSRQGTSVPLDGGLSLLLAAGIGLGVVAAYRKFKNQAATI